jgi:sugar/nucleoside kinase (ribokinase family)
LIGIGNDIWTEKPIKPEKIADTIGAGDAFASGFLFGYLNNESIKDCIRYGLICAKETVQTIEDTSNVINAALLKEGK